MPWLTWLLNAAYLLLIAAASPLLLYRTVVQGKYRQGWGQKLLGRLPVRDSNKPCIWLHAVSVGEVLQLQTVLRELADACPDHEFLISATTSTGYAVAQKQYPEHRVCFFPLDFTWAVRTAIRRVRPAAVVLVELELWPNFVLTAARENVPIALINGRISERSFRGYRKIRPLMKRLLGCIETFGVQNETYAERLIQLGAPAERIRVTGSVKFDRIETDRANRRTRELRQALGIQCDETVFIAGSTQYPEEEFAVESWLQLRREFPKLRLVLVPRHQERFEEVARMVAGRALRLLRRSHTRNADASPRPARSASNGGESEMPPVCLLDTLGELTACWGLADLAFVGGSLTNRGGQNMIEPAAYGAAVLFGPNTQNFRDVVEALLSHEAARVVSDAQDLTRTLRELLAHPETSREHGLRAQRFVLSQQGATTKTVELLRAVLAAIPCTSRSTPAGNTRAA